MSTGYSEDALVEQTIVNDELKKQFLSLAGRVIRRYKAILPDASANEFNPIKTCLAVLAEKIRNFTEEADIDDIMNQVGDLLDESIARASSPHIERKAKPNCLGNPRTAIRF